MLYQQPQGGPLQIDWSNPITAGLKIAVIGSFPNLNLVNQKSSTAGNFAAVATSGGLAGEGKSGPQLGYPVNLAKNALTIAACGKFVSATENFSPIIGKSGGGSGFSGLEIHGGSNQQDVFNIAGNTTSYVYATPNDGLPRIFYKNLAVRARADGTASSFINGLNVNNGAYSGGLVNRTDIEWSISRAPYDGINPCGVSKDALYAYAWERDLTDAEIASIAANPWQIIIDPDEDDEAAFFAVTGSNAAVSPTSATLAIAGYAPLLAQTANQGVTASAAALVITGYAPGVLRTDNQGVIPNQAALAVSGFSPALAQTANQSSSPSPSPLTLTGYGPSIAQTVTLALAPGANALTLTGYAPGVVQSANQSTSPGPAALALTGYAPAVAQSVTLALVPGAGTLAMVGYSPTVGQTENQSLAPGAGALTQAGYAPAVTQSANQSIAPGVAIIAVAGHAPEVAQSDNRAVAAGAGSMTVDGFAPSIAQSVNQAAAPAAGAVAITGYSPAVMQQSASISLMPGAGQITIAGHAPTVSQSGGAGRPKRKPFQVETSRGVLEVATLDEVADIVRAEKRRPKAAPVAVRLAGVKVSTPSLAPRIDYMAIEQRVRAQVQAEMDDEEDLLMMLA